MYKNKILYCSDVISLLHKLYPDKVPSIVLMGHSLGGAIAVNVASTSETADLPIIGLVVIDVVEGSAMESLASMQSFLRSRPKSFKSLKDAISWGYKYTLIIYIIATSFVCFYYSEHDESYTVMCTHILLVDLKLFVL